MEFNLEEIKELHKNRKWITWEEEGYLISCVEKLEASRECMKKEAIWYAQKVEELEASNKKLRNVIEELISYGVPKHIEDGLYKALEE